MKVLIVTPAPPCSRAGNRVTALRWQRLLRQLGHRVVIDQRYRGQRCDMLVALHARRSASSVRRFHETWPKRPLVLALTGTDLYQDLDRSDSAQRSLELADRLVVLQPHGVGQLPKRHQRRARVIYQSAARPTDIPPPVNNAFEVSVVGHLRPVKDPFRAAMAARRLPASSRVRIVQIGAALSQAMQRRARREIECNPRFCWLGELPRWQTIKRLARSRLLVVTSKLEGGANVLSEAIVASVPVLSSRISGSMGLLGDDYPGYFEVGDTRALARLLERAETDCRFYETLASRCERLRPLLDPANECRAWQGLLEELAYTSRRPGRHKKQ